MHQPLFLLYGISQRRAIGRLWHGVAVIFIFGPGKEFLCYGERILFTQSFSKAYTPYDNSVMESFFSNLKREELYRSKYRSENELRAAVDKYMIFYNEQRPHATNQYKTPAQKESEFFRKPEENLAVSN